MGCCISTNKTAEEELAPPKQHLPERALAPEPDTSLVRGTKVNDPPPPPPPPLPLEEETVKEVLSETPTPKPPLPKVEKEIPKPSLLSVVEEIVEKKAPVNAVEDVSEMSEICSLSESVSTTTMTERKDDEERSRDDGEVRQRVDRSPARVPRKRLVSGDYAGKTEKGGWSPARRYEPSPGRKMDNAMMSVHSKEMSHSTRRRVPANNGPIRRDPGDSSGRRSRSPATRSVDPGSYRSTIGRSPSSRKTGRSPGRAPPLSEDNGRKLEETKEGSWQTNESLENPLVSLECFIFL